MEFFKEIKRIWLLKRSKNYQREDPLSADPMGYGDSGNIPHVISQGLHLAPQEEIYACPLHDAMQRSRTSE